MNITYQRTAIEIENGKWTVSYGEKHADYFSGEWKMIIYKNGEEKAFYTNSELLDMAQGERPVDLVLAGMAKYFMK
jgi:hypothetical protein